MLAMYLILINLRNEYMKNNLQILSRKYQLTHIRPFKHVAGTNNYVVIAYSEQYKADVVLKIGSKIVIDKEIQALQYFQGAACPSELERRRGCVQLLGFDQEFSDVNSALLLEYVYPGNSLKDLFLQGSEEASIAIFAEVVKKLHENKDKKLDYGFFQTIEQRCSFLHSFESYNDRLQKLLPQAAKVADQLVASQGKQLLLHGDLHHENVLQRGDDWVMIDPQGVVSELEYEVGAFIRNPIFMLLEQDNLEQIIAHRFNRLSQLLNLDKQRIIDWSFVQAILAACYAEQDGQDAAQQYFIEIAEMIVKYKTHHIK